MKRTIKPIRQVETSMSKKYKGTPKVSFKTIDDIKKMGMTAALKKAGTSKNPEYLEGIKRMYGAKRLAAAQGGVKKAAAPMAKSPRVAERTTVAAKKSAAGAKSGSEYQQAMANAANKKKAAKKSTLSEYQQALASKKKASKKSSSNKYFDNLAKRGPSGGR